MDFSGGTIKVPLAAADGAGAVTLLACAGLGEGGGGGAGVEFAAGAGVDAVTALDFAGACAFAQMAHTSTSMNARRHL